VFLFVFQAIQSAIYQGAEDNITRLDAKTKYGRPRWDDIFKDVANKHKGLVTHLFFILKCTFK